MKYVIQNEAQLHLAYEALNDLETALEALRLRMQKENPKLFKAFAESAYRKDIRKIKAEIYEYENKDKN